MEFRAVYWYLKDVYVRPEVTQQFVVHMRTGSEERTTFDMVKYPTPHFNKF